MKLVVKEHRSYTHKQERFILNIRIQSVKAMREYLEDDLRFEMSALQNIDVEIIKQCVEVGRKKTELRMLLEFLERR